MTRYTFSHIDVSTIAQRRPYKSSASFRRERIERVREEHGPRLIEEYEHAFDGAIKDRPTNDACTPRAVALEFELYPKTKALNLSRKTEGTRQGAVRIDRNGIRKVVLFVPDQNRDIIRQLLYEYSYGDFTGGLDGSERPPNEARVSEIQHIRQATFNSFWRDDSDAIPNDPQTQMWWGLWCFNDQVTDVIDTARLIGCRVAEPDAHLHFPDTRVVPVYGPRVAIEILLFGTLGISELRRATDSPTFFMESARGEEHEWIEDLAERTTWPHSDTPTICVLDTGVNRGHPLLEPAVAPDVVDSVNQGWGIDDHHGHGTGMMGICIHGDLTAALLDQGERTLSHRAESVKVLPPQGFDPNSPNSYGPIVQSATALAEINNPDAPFRVYCLAITNKNRTGAEATAWSAAIDQSAAGATIGDEGNNAVKRLFVLSTGNVQDDVAIDALDDPDAFPAEDPSQAWNALSIGGYTDKTEIHDTGFTAYAACRKPGELSPYSRTSNLWSGRMSPFKPDLVLEAGNRAINVSRTDVIAGLPSLSLLSTGPDVARLPLETFWATSAATAQGARMAAQIAAAYPSYWPETVRAVMIHSAEWTEHMLSQFQFARTGRQRAELIRRYGYGVPNLERGLGSAKNHLAIVAQRTIQPFQKHGSVVKFNEAHLYRLPWPTQVLEDLGESQVKVKTTLSYFVEPNPSFSTAIDPMRYQSFGLRFDLKRPNETREMFLKRRNLAERLDRSDHSRPTPDKNWMLGQKQISSGSLHSDIWSGTAAQLALRDMLWVYPVSGWWRERKSLNRYNSRARYSLVLTVETDDQSIDLYTPISALVDTLVNVEVNVNI